jgi:DNA-binding GntR family transcriptional regulator
VSRPRAPIPIQKTGSRGNSQSNPRPGRDSVQRAADQLRRLIVTGEIPPGSQLSQVQLARRLDLSTTPVREALRQLEAEGLVESRRNLRPRVPVFDPTDLDAVYSSRILLESLGIALTIVGSDPDHMALLRRDLEQMRVAAKRRQLAAWEEMHGAFHMRLVSGCESSLLNQIEVVVNRSNRYRRMSVIGEQPFSWAIGEREHEAIVHACEDRDPQAAQELLARHLSRSAFSVRAHLAPEADLPAVRTALELVRGTSTVDDSSA